MNTTNSFEIKVVKVLREKLGMTNAEIYDYSQMRRFLNDVWHKMTKGHRESRKNSDPILQTEFVGKIITFHILDSRIEVVSKPPPKFKRYDQPKLKT